MNELSFNKLNIGGSLTALMHAYVTETPIIIDIPQLPFELDKCPPHWDLRFLGFCKKVQVTKLQVWERLSFLLSMAGLVVFPSNIKDAREEPDGLVLILNQNKRIKVRYKELHSFDRDKEDVVIAYDWFDVKSGSIHGHDCLYDVEDDFCSRVIFYPSKRNGTSSEMMDVCAVSMIPTHLIQDVEYSPIYSRLKVIKMMKNAGIKGKVNKYNKRGETVHLAIKIEHSHREVSPITNNDINIEELIKKRPSKHGDLWKLTQRFNSLKTLSILQA